MKTIYILMILTVGFLSTGNVLAQENKEDSTKIEINSEDSVEYKLLVFDSGFESYLATVPHSKDFYSNEYYRNWNIQYCSEWNR
ncbi:MAG: DUF6146 family protein, partial [Bacteroidales bacterium]